VNKFFLIGIIFLAIILRFINIDSNPKAMYGDELTLAFDAYSISQTGYDQKGEKLPLVFQLGGARPPVYVYATIPLASILGPTALAVRTVSVLSGIGIVILLYFIVVEFFDKRTALFASFLGAISPWGISLSRGGFETNLALFLAFLGIFGLLKSLKRPIWLLMAGFSFALSMQTYATYRLTIPLILTILIMLNFQKFKKITKNRLIFIPTALILLASLLLSLYLMVSIGGRDRFSNINVFQSDQAEATTVQKVSVEREKINLPKFMETIFHNKYMEKTGIFFQNYLDNFTGQFLFLNGDSNPRHNPSGMGEFYAITPILVIFALIALLKSSPKLLWMLAIWILLTPVASSLVGGSHALRSSFLLPPILILSAIGFSKIWELKRLVWRKTIMGLIIFAISAQFIYFYERVYFMAPQLYGEFWSYSAKRATQIAAENKGNFDYIILSNDIPNMEYAYPTYNKLDPRLVMEQNKIKSELNQYAFFKYENVYIGSLPKGVLVSFLSSLPGSYFYIGPLEDKNVENIFQLGKVTEDPDRLMIIEGE
jgi:4-amino-4-deoxy-L-arabinose transferase-like glycosyltransferase